MAEEIERTGGTVEKFVGDAVMAVYGAQAALEADASFASLGLEWHRAETARLLDGL